ncbi:NAD-dependent epimerase/dehydratase family protein [Paenibacillus faecis]|uniref:NAD-dependent epimerase/dehydratase family protein n=1 Tax=Paenibacillus faecis TaxID=862114 RepID=A0A5D0CZA5_9BACL|nr:NAD-dependent epimerase/dehydratase family protein [Paenibacillus faecis]TYA14197.1 NAD-dependent epimerase/dehydratase family protein [Paenibacillus faecis]
MGKVLVLGGTRYFGKRLVDLLLQDGVHEVTVATRGTTKAAFDHPVIRRTVDRTDEGSLRSVAAAGPWDVVFDNICYSPGEAEAAIRAFDGHVGRYILTSTLSVYGFGASPLVEEDFDPYTYERKSGDRDDFDYGEGKRQAEAAFFQLAEFPVAAMRIPIVLGPDDYTRRLHFHIERVMKGTPIGMPNPEAAMSFISSAETASFLRWLGGSELRGPINASSEGTITLRSLMELIERETGKPALLQAVTDPGDASPFGVGASWYMDISKARAAGYRFSSLQEWLPDLIRNIAQGRG